MSLPHTRRHFLGGLSAAGAASLVRSPGTVAAEGALETASVRLPKIPSICVAPQDIAEDLLRAEGITDIRYVPTRKTDNSALPSVAQRLVDGGFTPRYDYALQSLQKLPYDKWREWDAEDTMRFYALRMHEAGLIKSSPQKIIADGTDWRFLDEIKRELKA